MALNTNERGEIREDTVSATWSRPPDRNDGPTYMVSVSVVLLDGDTQASVKCRWTVPSGTYDSYVEDRLRRFISVLKIEMGLA